MEEVVFIRYCVVTAARRPHRGPSIWVFVMVLLVLFGFGSSWRSLFLFLSGGSSWLHLFFRRESPPYAACLMPMAEHRPYRMSEALIRPSLLGQAWCPLLSATTHSDQVGTIHSRRADSAHGPSQCTNVGNATPWCVNGASSSCCQVAQVACSVSGVSRSCSASTAADTTRQPMATTSLPMKEKKTRHLMSPKMISTSLPRRDQILRSHPNLLIHCLPLLHTVFNCSMSNCRHSTIVGPVGTSPPSFGHACTAKGLHAVNHSAFPQWTGMCAPITFSVRSAQLDLQSLSVVCAVCTFAQSVCPMTSRADKKRSTRRSSVASAPTSSPTPGSNDIPCGQAGIDPEIFRGKCADDLVNSWE